MTKVLHNMTDSHKQAGGGIQDMSASGFFDGSPVATFVIDASHNVTHFNKACAITLGVRAEDVIGTQDLGRIFYGHKRPVMADLIKADELKTRLKKIPEWELEKKHIERTFEFDDFSESIDFVNGVAEVAEDEEHHPDIAPQTGQSESVLRKAPSLRALRLVPPDRL